MSRVIVYIDGFNLYFGLRTQGWRRYYWLDPRALAMSLLQPGQHLEAVKYFTARISAHPTDPDKHRRQGTWLEAIGLLPDLRLFYGHYLDKQRACHQCGHTWVDHEEKMTDVQMAVELLQDAHDNAFDTALLISADSDLAPPVTAVLARHPGKRVVVVFPPKRHSKKLESIASAKLVLGRGKLEQSQLPETIRKPDGYVLRRPDKWK